MDTRWTWGADAQLQTRAISHRASFLPVESSTVDLVNVWSPGYRWSTRWWSLVRLWTWAPPFLLASTRCHSRDRCSQALHAFCRSSTSVYYTERKTKNKKRGGGGAGKEASSYRDILEGKPVKIYIHLWQSRIEIEYYSIAYFERITEFDAL